MTDEELDCLLASASATLAKKVKSGSDVNILLSNLLDVRPEKSMLDPRPFMARVRLRQIIGDLYRAEILANSVTKILPTSERLGGVSKALSAAFSKASTDDLSEVAELVQLLNVTAARALAATMSPTATSDILLEGHVSALIGALVGTLGRSLARASDLAMDLPRIPGADDEMTTRDLRGIDLSSHYVGSIQILYDFIWDDKTAWPAALESDARENSEAIREGHYRIKGIAPFSNMCATSTR